MNGHSSLRRKATNLSLSAALLETAKDLGINLSRACERGLELQIRETQAQAWLEANREAILSSNDYVAKNGMPLARHRQF